MECLEKRFPQYGMYKETINNMVHVDPVRKIVYFEVPKAGCSSIKKYLIQKMAGNVNYDKNHSLIHDRQKSPLLRPFDLPEGEWYDLMERSGNIFSFVRNPYSRAVSAYLDKFKMDERSYHKKALGFSESTEPTFEEVLVAVKEKRNEERDIHFMTQDYLTGSGSVKFNIVGRLENFNIYLQAISIMFYGENNSDLEKIREFGQIHKTASDVYKISREEMLLISDIYKEDFGRFNYEMIRF
ncbi:sulfotransferase family 2 domain-containing protein [Gluconacetobacter asukensis]|uniref:Sulfotransferase family 2 domain-containing protein n=1 Tax=Gluconacetobacter asukensis TaxID=1017181 RepID=A0A7W4J2L2_9PROT|nr:sulfotransferase family 2 domain-containing protein [Gluconacetobacter asukensis]MBB2173566.1 sulfotransferase family 2 domain-containing protein [Gluconacetobacter asukensis]